MKTIKDILKANPYLFEVTKEHERLKKECERQAKLMMIGDIFRIRHKLIEQEKGRDAYGNEFNRLFDLTIDQLHIETIKAQDEVYFKGQKRF